MPQGGKKRHKDVALPETERISATEKGRERERDNLEGVRETRENQQQQQQQEQCAQKRATLPNFMPKKKKRKKTAYVSFVAVFVVVFWVKGKINMRLRMHLNKKRETGERREVKKSKQGGRENGNDKCLWQVGRAAEPRQKGWPTTTARRRTATTTRTG